MARTRTGIPLRARAITIELSPARPVGLGSPGEPSQGPATTSCVLGSVDLLERAVLVDEDHDELDEGPDAVHDGNQPHEEHPAGEATGLGVRNLATRSCSVHRRIHRRGNENDRQDNDRDRKHNVPDRAALLAEVEYVGSNSSEEEGQQSCGYLGIWCYACPESGLAVAGVGIPGLLTGVGVSGLTVRGWGAHSGPPVIAGLGSRPWNVTASLLFKALNANIGRPPLRADVGEVLRSRDTPHSKVPRITRMWCRISS